MKISTWHPVEQMCSKVNFSLNFLRGSVVEDGEILYLLCKDSISVD